MTWSSYPAKEGVKELYYITHVDNIPSLLKEGILSHELVVTKRVKYTAIYDSEIVSSRGKKILPNGQSLWKYANLYFNARNPMLFRVVLEKTPENIVVLGVSKNALARKDIFVSDGNAASHQTEFFNASVLGKVLTRIAKGVALDWWKDFDGTKRRIMAEVLVPDFVQPEHIHDIFVADDRTAEKVRSYIRGNRPPVIPEPSMFFQPIEKRDLTPYLAILRGDMFFSRLQTLTISVNCEGVMGKGVASRAKYQFPDVYVDYQAACRSGKLRMGKPYLYKRERSYDAELADNPESLSMGNGETWFLIFATKTHWREDADFHGIEQGLRWVKDNYRTLGLKSLAIPALGCGLGNLEWKDVGPLMCKYLNLDIPVWIYLPTEKSTPGKYLSKEYLLSA